MCILYDLYAEYTTIAREKFKKIYGALSGTWTHTSFRPLPPQDSVSAYSTISAYLRWVGIEPTCLPQTKTESNRTSNHLTLSISVHHLVLVAAVRLELTHQWILNPRPPASWAKPLYMLIRSCSLNQLLLFDNRIERSFNYTTLT